MGTVRCPKHKIPYNDDNPRGCPACAREKDRGKDGDAIRELQRASRVARGLEEPPRPDNLPLVEFLTQQPEVPVRRQTGFERLYARARRHRYVAVASAVVVVLLVVLMVVKRAKFVPAPDPPAVATDARPLAIQPGSAVTGVFELLGPRQPEAVPNEPQHARYAYGTRLSFDVLNGRVQAINVGVGNRSWRGVTVGLVEDELRGVLAMLGPVHERDGASPIATTTVAGHQVYPSPEQRPARILVVQVRPPNGCFDLEVTLRPRIEGVLLTGGERYASIGKGAVTPNWAVTEFRVLNREIAGSGSAAATCPAP